MKREQLKQSLEGMNTDQLFDLIYSDPATGLLNRRAFQTGYSQVVAIIDLDSLKWINDNHGHEAGDRALKTIADMLRLHFGPDRTFRLSGDEFAVRANSAATLAVNLEEIRETMPGFTYGIGRTLGEADAVLTHSKEIRERKGLRAPRGERPPFMREVA